MRLAAGVLALTLFASFARAEDARSAEPTRSAADVTHSKVPLRVVRVMPESRQALLFDRTRATHVLAEVGGKIDGYTIEAIDDDEVTLTLDGKQIVLAAPARGADRRHDRDAAAVHVRSAAGAKQPDTSAVDPAPVDPYGDAAIRVVEAPGATARDPGGQPSRTIEPGDGGVRVAQAPSSSPGAPGATAEAPATQTGLLEIRGSAIRIVSAPAGANGAPAAAAQSTSGPSGAPAADARTDDTRATGDAPAAQNAIRVVEAPAGVAGVEAADTPALPTSVPSAGVAARATRTDARPPAPRAPEVRAAAADKRTLDARALADIMTADSRGRGARKPASAALDHATAGPRPASTAQPASEIRTTGAAAADAIALSRSDVDGALADFARLSAAVRGSFSASGLAVDQVADGTIFQRAGLRSGDVVTAVDGARLRSLDDAANLYARASTATAITAQIIRDGKPMTLHVAIR
jgi:type II secretory pathway component PulC